MKSPHVFDKAKYHGDTVKGYRLTEEHAANHTVVFLRWLIEQRMMSEFFEQEGENVLRQFRAGEISIHEVYSAWDCCLDDDMLSGEGNNFALHYFDFEHGHYISDYVSVLQGKLPSVFHVDYSEKNYQKVRPVTDRRYDEWMRTKEKAKRPKRKWWPF